MHIRLGHAGIEDPSVDLSRPDKKKILESTETLQIKKCITANTSETWQHAAHTTDQLTSLAAKQESHKKASVSMKSLGRPSKRDTELKGLIKQK